MERIPADKEQKISLKLKSLRNASLKIPEFPLRVEFQVFSFMLCWLYFDFTEMRKIQRSKFKDGWSPVSAVIRWYHCEALFLQQQVGHCFECAGNMWHPYCRNKCRCFRPQGSARGLVRNQHNKLFHKQCLMKKKETVMKMYNLDHVSHIFNLSE